MLVSRGPDGCLLVTGDDHQDLPALEVEVVDTTGCGDAVSAGFITGVLSGWSLEDAARLAMAAGALVAGGLGSDAGIVDLAGTVSLLEQHADPTVAARIRSYPSTATPERTDGPSGPARLRPAPGGPAGRTVGVGAVRPG